MVASPSTTADWLIEAGLQYGVVVVNANIAKDAGNGVADAAVVCLQDRTLGISVTAALSDVVLDAHVWERLQIKTSLMAGASATLVLLRCSRGERAPGDPAGISIDAGHHATANVTGSTCPGSTESTIRRVWVFQWRVGVVGRNSTLSYF